MRTTYGAPVPYVLATSVTNLNSCLIASSRSSKKECSHDFREPRHIARLLVSIYSAARRNNRPRSSFHISGALTPEADIPFIPTDHVRPVGQSIGNPRRCGL